MYSTGEIAEKHGLTLRAVRFYEEHGLITPTRRGNKRVFTQRDSDRLAEIVKLTRYGFTLREIRDGKLSEHALRAQLAKLTDRRNELDRTIAEFEDSIADKSA